jgi:hypothetical protein
MHGSDTIRIAREGLPRGGLIPLEERGEVALWPSQVGALAPCQRVFEVAPPPCKRVQLWTRGWQADQAYSGRQGASRGRMGPAVVPEQEVQAVREGRGESLHDHRHALGLQRRPCQEEPLTRRGVHGAIDRDPLHDGRHHADGRHARGGEAPPADGEPADAAVVLAAPPDRTGMRGGNRPLEVCRTGGLE